MEEEDGCESPVYDYADMESEENCTIAPTPAASVPPPAQAQDELVVTSSPVILSLSLDPLSPVRSPSLPVSSFVSPPVPTAASARCAASASSVRTLPSSADTTVIGEAAHGSTHATAGIAQPRNLTHAFLPMPTEHSETPTDTQASEVLSPPPFALPTPPPARASWPIGYARSGSKPSSSQKSSCSKRKSTHSGGGGLSHLSQTSTESGSRFASCPVCSKTVALFDMDRHLDEECGKEPVASKMPKKDESHDARSRPASSIKREFALSQQTASGSSFTRCPMCDASVPIATINHHIDVECGRETRKAPQATTRTNTVAHANTTNNGTRSHEATAAATLPPPSQLPASVTSAELGQQMHGPAAATAAPPVASSEPKPPMPMSTTATSAMNGAEPVPPAPESSAAAADSSAAAVDSSPHPFFTAGPRAASAFVPQRRNKTDGVKCATTSHFTLGLSPSVGAAAAIVWSGTSTVASTPTALLDLFECEWQDCAIGGDLAHEPRLCAAQDLALFHTNTKLHEPFIDEWSDIHIHSSARALAHSPALDLHSPHLLCNAPQHRRFRLSIWMLKSLLQKSIRLSRPAAAVRIAVQLMQTKLSEFLRRFTVIMLEDAILHPHLPVLVWLTLACGKANPACPFQPTLAHINVMLQMVHDVASVSTKDPLAPGESVQSERTDAQQPPASQSDEEDMMDDEHARAHARASATRASDGEASPIAPTLLDELPLLTPQQRLLVKCILVRASYGGSRGDVSMLRSYAALWCKRFHSENEQVKVATQEDATPDDDGAGGVRRWLPFLNSLYAASRTILPSHLLLEQPIDVRRVTYLRDDDLVLSAVDFHCSNIVTHLLKKESILRALAQLRLQDASSQSAVVCRILWDFRSSLTNKQLLRVRLSGKPAPDPVPDPVLSRLYQSMRTDIDLAAKRILQQTREM